MRTFGAALLATWLVTMLPAAGQAGTLEEAAAAYARGHYVRAAELVVPLAERGDPRAQTYLGVMYLRGQGVPQSFSFAAQWLRCASFAGEAPAQYFYGLLYDRGLGLPQDSILAEAWVSLAVAHASDPQRRRWALVRDAIAAKLSRADLDRAQQLAAAGFY